MNSQDLHIVGDEQLRLLLLIKNDGPAICERCHRQVDRATATSDPTAPFVIRFECHGATQDVTSHMLAEMQIRAKPRKMLGTIDAR